MTILGGIGTTLDRGDVLASRAAGGVVSTRLCPPSPRTYRVPTERLTHLGFPLVVSEAWVTVYTPDGRLIGKARKLPAARKLVSAYRRTT